MPIDAEAIAEIERQLAELSLDDRKALARRLVVDGKRRSHSDAAADKLLVYLRQLRQRTDCLPINREIERQAGLEGEDVSYLLKVLRRRDAIVIDYPWSGSADRTFELPW